MRGHSSHLPLQGQQPASCSPGIPLLLKSFRLECNCFTMFCQSLLYGEVNQLCVYIYLLVPERPSHSTPIAALRSSQRRAELPVLDSSSPQLCVLCMVWVCIGAAPAPCPLLSFPCWLHVSVLYVCISLPAPQTGSPVPFF